MWRGHAGLEAGLEGEGSGGQGVGGGGRVRGKEVMGHGTGWEAR